MIFTRKFVFVGIAAMSVAASGCTTTGSSGGTIQGLPKAEFSRVFIAALQVAAAEHCGDAVNGDLVRTNVIKYQTDRGTGAAGVASATKLFDNVRTDFQSRLARDEDYCTTNYKASPDDLKNYEKGQFPDVS